HLTSSAVRSSAVFILVGNAEVIVFIPGCRMETTTITNSLHRISVHMPVHYVYLVDKLLNIMISGKPGITLPITHHILEWSDLEYTLPITHHILQVAPFVLAFYPPNRASVS